MLPPGPPASRREITPPTSPPGPAALAWSPQSVVSKTPLPAPAQNTARGIRGTGAGAPADRVGSRECSWSMPCSRAPDPRWLHSGAQRTEPHPPHGEVAADPLPGAERANCRVLSAQEKAQ